MRNMSLNIRQYQTAQTETFYEITDQYSSKMSRPWRQKLSGYLRLEERETEWTWQLNAMWNPGWDPKEKDISGMEIVK